MKKVSIIAALVLVIFIIIFSCNGKNSTTKFQPKSDTTRTLAVYIDFSDTTVKTGPTYQIARDMIRVDSFLKVHIYKDSFWYYKPAFLKDSTGRKFGNDSTWVPIYKPFIYAKDNVDTGIVRLNRIVEKLKSH